MWGMLILNASSNSTHHPLSFALLQAEIEARPLLYNNFMTMTAEDNPVYNAVPGYDQLRKTLNDKLAEYNESNAVMDLVLFQQAMEHICRITRIISQPRGNAMLVGVGGSGKQSLARSGSDCLPSCCLCRLACRCIHACLMLHVICQVAMVCNTVRLLVCRHSQTALQLSM